MARSGAELVVPARGRRPRRRWWWPWGKREGERFEE
uniref:Uncharacterized protein n=1 Tax=Arundo donax TaxID=35708 RepID=A0A0A9BBS6_ARUDO